MKYISPSDPMSSSPDGVASHKFISDSKADSYGNEKLKRKWPKSVFWGRTKNMVRVNLMATVLFWHGFDNP